MRLKSASLLTALTLSLCGLSLTAAAAARGAGEREALRVAEINRQLLAVPDLARVSEAERTRHRQAVGGLLDERARTLEALMLSQPNRAARLTLSDATRARLAQQVPGSAARLEKSVRLTGVLEYLIEDSVDLKTHTDHVFLETAPGQRVRLAFTGRIPPGTRSGRQVRVHKALALGDSALVSEVEMGALEPVLQEAQLREALAPDAQASSYTLPAATYPATGSVLGGQPVLAVLVNLPSFTLPAAVTNKFVRDSLIGNSYTSNPNWSVRDFWLRASNNQAYIDHTNTVVLGPFLLSSNYNSGCDNYGLRDEVISRIDPTVDFKRFSRLVIVMPPNDACGWAGTANVGTRSISTADGTALLSTSWNRADTMTTRKRAVQLLTHEMGHNLGLYHAKTRDHGEEVLGPVGASGSLVEYGDTFSTMGSWNLGFYATPQLNQLGWVSNANVRVHETTPGGSRLIQNMSIRPFGPKAFKVRRGSNNNTWLWLEVRRATDPYNQSLASGAHAGVLVHYEDAFTSTDTHLIDFTPETASFEDGTLKPGQTWNDPHSNLTLRVDSISDAGAWVTITYR